MARKLAAGNWKMNGTGEALGDIDALVAAHPAPICDLLFCAPSTLLSRLSDRTNATNIATGGQD